MISPSANETETPSPARKKPFYTSLSFQVLAGVVIVYCSLLVLFNLLVDLLYGLLDHRISLYD